MKSRSGDLGSFTLLDKLPAMADVFLSITIVIDNEGAVRKYLYHQVFAGFAEKCENGRSGISFNDCVSALVHHVAKW